MKKIIKSRVFLIIILCVISCCIGVYGANTYNSNSVLYTTSDGSKITVSEALDELYSNGLCSPFKFVKVGDYVSMTPTSTSYTTDTSKTGYTSSQTINPSELNLWRVIKINEDGTIEVVSEYTSSVYIYFRGQTGYQNLVGYLNEIASQYENNKYTTGSRIMGYNGQTAYITDISKLTSTSAPWTSSTSNNNNETVGGGDILYIPDTDLVQSVLGTLVANKVGATTAREYWLGSRYYSYEGSYHWQFRGCRVVGNKIYRDNGLWVYYGGFVTYSDGNAIRPILTLKSELKATGSGTKDDPYVLK